MPLTLGLLGTVKDRLPRRPVWSCARSLSLLLHGELKSGNDFDLTLDSGTVDLDKLLRLLPMVADGSAASGKKKKGPTIDGDLRVSGGLTKKATSFRHARSRCKMPTSSKTAWICRAPLSCRQRSAVAV